MDARDLTPEQQKQLHASLYKQRKYFERLIARMDAGGWYTSSTSYCTAQAIRSSILALELALRAEEKLPPFGPAKDAGIEMAHPTGFVPKAEGAVNP